MIRALSRMDETTWNVMAQINCGQMLIVQAAIVVTIIIIPCPRNIAVSLLEVTTPSELLVEQFGVTAPCSALSRVSWINLDGLTSWLLPAGWLHVWSGLGSVEYKLFLLAKLCGPKCLVRAGRNSSGYQLPVHVILSIQERLSVGNLNADDFFLAKKGSNLWLWNTLHKGHNLV